MKRRELQPGAARIGLVIGRKGSGKSWRVKRWLASVPRWVAWDLRGEYVEVPRARLWSDVRDFAAHLAEGGSVERDVFACPSWQFGAWCRWVYSTGNLVAVIEELPRFCSAGHAPAPLADLIDRNRHANVWLVGIASRLSRIPKDLVHQADELLISRATLPADLAYLADWLGPRAAQQIANLPQHHFAHFQP